MIFRMKNGYKILVDHFEPYYGDLGCFTWMGILGFVLGFYDHAWFMLSFESKMFIWIKSGGIWKLDVLRD